MKNIFLYLILNLLCIFNYGNCLFNSTQINRSFDRILSRKTRFIVFPKDTTLLLTPSFGKHLLEKTPRGVFMSIEVDFYHSLPDTIDGWRPKIFDKYNKMKTKPKTKTTTTTEIPNIISINDFYYIEKEPFHNEEPLNGDYIWTPSNQMNLERKNKNFYPISHRKDFFAQENLFTKNSRRKLWNHKRKNWTSRPTYEQTIKWKPIYSNPWRETNSHHSINKNQYFNKMSYQIPIRNENNFENDWIHNRPHRERRELFNNLENIGAFFGLELKACVLRTICEVRHFLLPPGKSLIQDVIRILFTIPTKNEWKDEYSNATRSKETDCKYIYNKVCPISLIEMVLNKERII